ncbi:hypothetical protein P43SY_009716 [Pythium insidiosum]|uniref:FH2 domain-containing protein n=1 Tax=Pythium insidiosum TaxID=114742 RepID=A0AAD5MCI2_PYTIN|nr:hypothetical protein P43SY_009716 [Pythium insidiosum]
MGNNASNGGISRYLVGCPQMPSAPPEHEVRRLFEELLRAKNVAAVVLEELLIAETTETQWMYICLNKLLETSEHSSNDWLDAQTCVQEILDLQLQQDHLPDLFRAMRLNLILRHRDWVDKFLAAQGMEALVVLLDPAKRSSASMPGEILSVLFALSHSNRGMLAIVQCPNCCPRLVAALAAAPCNVLRSRILKLLSTLCCHSQAAQRVVVESFSTVLTPSRFDGVARLVAENESDMELLVAVLTFLNTVLSTTINASERIAIREELERERLVSRLEALRVTLDAATDKPSLLVQIQVFFKGLENDRGGLERRRSLQLEVPSLTQDDEPQDVQSTHTAAEIPADRNDPAVLGPPSPPAPSEPTERTPLQTRRSLRLEIAELATDAPGDSPPSPALQEKKPSEDDDSSRSPAPLPRRSSGKLLPSLSIPETPVVPPAPTTQATPSIESILAQLQQSAQALDATTNQRLMTLLSSLAASITATPDVPSASAVVERLEKSLAVAPASPPQTSSSSSSPSTGGIARVRLAIQPPVGECIGTPGKPSQLRPLIVGVPEIAFGSAAAMPAKRAIGAFPHTQLSPTAEEAPKSPTHSHCDEEQSPRRSMADTESCDESWQDVVDTQTRKTSGAKLALAGFFQHLKRGQMLPTTPAPTPMATASVKKDAKRPIFPTFAGTASAAPSPMPPPHGAMASPFALPPLTPLRPSLALPPLTPVRHQLPPMSPMVGSHPGHSFVSDHHAHLDSVREEDSPVVTGTALQTPTALSSSSGSDVSSTPDISKFHKLLAMGAPKAAVRAKMQQAGLDPGLLDQPTVATPTVTTVASALAGTPPQTQPIPSSQPTPQDPPPTTSGTDVSKFRKLLSMGAPLAAVKAKMVQAGLDPELLEQKAAFTDTLLPASVPAQPAAPAATTPEQQPERPETTDEAAKFRKLLAMGAPLEAVKAKMRQAGVDPALLDKPPSSSPSTAPTAPVAGASGSSTGPRKVKDDPEYAKFFKLLSMGAPPPAVKAKMTQAGLNPALLDTPEAELPGTSSTAATGASESTPAAAPVPAPTLVKDDPEYAKFFKLLSMGAPPPAVKAKMTQAGLNPALLDTPDAAMPSKRSDNNASEANSAPLAAVLVKDDPEYAKFFKLQAMGAPAAAVKAKMTQAGLNPDLLDTPDAVLSKASGSSPETAPSPAPTKLAAGSALASLFAKPPSSDNQATVVLVKDNPEYAKFFKLLTMAALTSGIPAPTKRGNLSLAIKPPVFKPTTRPFYWQQLKGDAIKGTIWEEIEQVQKKENNELLVVLQESELNVLETEFPAQTAPMTGPGTGGRPGRSLSMDTVSKELTSPRVVFLIDRSRANNISIIIKQFRMPHAAIREAIMKVDTQVLTLERVQGLLKILPSDEEVAAITGYQGDPLTLNEAERVLKELISVPRLKQRLLCMQAKLQLPVFVRDLQVKVERLKAASTEIGVSAEFKTVLAVVLQVGNKMNQGTARGSAKGFRLGDLPKLAQLKSSDKTTTLLHFVARMLRQKTGNLVRLSESLASLYDVQNIPITELPSDMAKIQEIADLITNELGAQTLKNAIEEKEACDYFVSVMTQFTATATQTVNALRDELDQIFQQLKSTMLRFSFQSSDEDEDPATPAPMGTATSSTAVSPAVLGSACEFFTTIYEFSVALVKADRENEVKRVREETRARQLSQKPKSNLLGPRSMSSRDMLSSVRKPAVPKKDESPTAATESADTSKGPSSAGGPRVSPMLRQRSASLSSIVEGSAMADAIALAVNMSSVKSPAKMQSDERKGTPPKQSSEDTGSKTSPASVRSGIKPPTKIIKDKRADDEATKPKASVLPLPGKIVKSSKAPAVESPETEPEKAFDVASIDEIHTQLTLKHAKSELSKSADDASRGNNDNNNNNAPSEPLEPNGGQYSTQIAVRLLTSQRAASIRYRVIASTAPATAIPSANDLVLARPDNLVATSGDVIVLPPFPCRIYAVTVKNGLQTSSLVVSSEYKIFAAKYMYLVPYFNGEFHGRVVRLQLDVRGKKRPRPARFFEFSDYETTLGMGPYPSQVAVIDMAAVHPSYKGFYGGFTAFGRTAFLNETFLKPAADDPNYWETAWRVQLEARYTPHPKRTAAAPTRFFRDAEYLYLAPFFNGVSFVGQLLRVLAMTFDMPVPVIEQLNLTAVDPDLRGFSASFADDTARFAYLVPRENENGLLGKLVRVALDDFSARGVTVLDLKALNPRYVGFSHGFRYKNFAYLVPFRRPLQGDERTTNLREFPVTASGVVVRVDLTTFNSAESIDLAAINPRLAGFSGAIRVTHYAYFVPYMRVKEPASVEVNPYSGLVARLDLRDFRSVAFLDLAQVDDDLRGFIRGFAYKQYVFLVPHRSQYDAPGRVVQSGKVVRIDTNDFSHTGVAFLDLAAATRSQVPDMPDTALRGFSGGVVSGKYGFFAPYFNGATFSGRVCRVNLDKFDEVQTLDLTQLDGRLRGFAGAILTREEEPLETDLFGEFQIRPGTTTPYDYVY